LGLQGTQTVVSTASAAAVLVATMAWRLMPWLVWNTSESAPIGLYRVQTVGKLMVNDLVIVIPPEPLATFLADAGHLPHGVPLLKRVHVVSDHTVCCIGYEITIDGAQVGQALERDYRGRPLPHWQGCRLLEDGDVFLMNWHPRSLDEGHFGVLPISSKVGRAAPLWTAAVVSDVLF
jgi:type IV secretory pathway protease TraF